VQLNVRKYANNRATLGAAGFICSRVDVQMYLYVYARGRTSRVRDYRAAIPATAARNDGSNASYIVCND